MIALAAGLRACGHDVTFVAPANFVEWIGEYGFRAQSDGVDVEAALQSPGADLQSLRWQMRYLRSELAPRLFDSVPRAAEGADVIVGSGVQLAAGSVAERLGVPYVSVAFCPCAVPSRAAPPPTVRTQRLPGWVNRLLWRFGLPIADAMLRPSINDGRVRLRLPPLASPIRSLFRHGVLIAADRDLAPIGPDAGPIPVQTDAWILEDKAALDPPVEEFLRRGPPPVYVGFGSMIAADVDRLGAAVLGAVRSAGCRAVVAGGWAGLGTMLAGPASPDAILSIAHAPHARLFPRVAAVVHHGGAGTTTAAARAGVPQVVIPQHYDQRYWAQRIDHLGIGSAHPPVVPTTDSLAAALSHALQPDIAARAQVIAKAVRTDGAKAAAQRLMAADA